MARPTKQGVDYFPLDVYLDDKFKFIQIKYKLEGFAILIKLFQKIYSYGYWYMWTEDEALIFADENKAELELVEGVIEEAVKRDIFNKNLFDEYSILTSKGIQKRYKEIVRRRKDVEVMAEYLLIDNGFGVIADIIPTLSIPNDVKSTQSKVKESKVKESKINKNIYAEFVTMTETEYNKLITDYGETFTKKMIDKLDNYKGSKGKKYASDYRTILNWIAKDKEKGEIDGKSKGNIGTGTNGRTASEESLRLERIAIETGLLDENGRCKPIGEIDF